MAATRFPLPALTLGQSTILEAGGTRIFLCRSAAGLHAMADSCPHQALSLEGARIRQGALLCPHHGARFSLADGTSLSPQLTPNKLTLLPCREAGEFLEVEV